MFFNWSIPIPVVLATAQWDWQVPFGIPVVPEVQNMTAVSSLNSCSLNATGSGAFEGSAFSRRGIMSMQPVCSPRHKTWNKLKAIKMNSQQSIGVLLFYTSILPLGSLATASRTVAAVAGTHTTTLASSLTNCKCNIERLDWVQDVWHDIHVVPVHELRSALWCQLQCCKCRRGSMLLRIQGTTGCCWQRQCECSRPCESPTAWGPQQTSSNTSRSRMPSVYL